MSEPTLIFLISQPRAGSTLTQRMIGAHPSIFTASESWILLHPLLIHRPDTIVSAYSQEIYSRALKDFNELTTNGAEKYQQAIATAYRSLYENVLHEKSKKIFLDKTPRYYYIIDEITSFFPDAKIILLIRNPLAVLNSVLRTWAHNGIFKLAYYRDDLLKAPDYLIRSLEKPNVVVTKYEDILSSPRLEMQKISDFLGLDFNERMVSFDEQLSPSQSYLYGDKSQAGTVSELKISNAAAWIRNLVNPQYWRLAQEYLSYLGSERILSLGYDYEDLHAIIEQHKPSAELLKNTFSMDALLDDQRDALVSLYWHKEHVKHCKHQINKLNQKIAKLTGEG